jgi:four helix bundle protein
MRDHTSLIAWRLASVQSRELYHFSTAHRTPALGNILDQLRRASLSIRLNIAEGYSWRPAQKWKHHLRIALGSAMETSECIRFLLESAELDPAEGERLLRRSHRVEKLLYGLLRSKAG